MYGLLYIYTHRRWRSRVPTYILYTIAFSAEFYIIYTYYDITTSSSRPDVIVVYIYIQTYGVYAATYVYRYICDDAGL